MSVRISTSSDCDAIEGPDAGKLIRLIIMRKRRGDSSSRGSCPDSSSRGGTRSAGGSCSNRYTLAGACFVARDRVRSLNNFL